MNYLYSNHLSYYQPQYFRPFPEYPQSEIWAAQQIKQPLYPQLKPQVFNSIAPFVKYGLKEAKATSFEHALQEVAAMTYLLGKGMDAQTAYLTVESWERMKRFKNCKTPLRHQSNEVERGVFVLFFQ
ncbi:hypothetical protein [Bacillus sp. 03113]|uniref:hypothetical protein n=1 Tax=Bacillus sp. 03113 TaxID=2578211 RepID=UPI0015E8CB19|nr:hypothetical protein [Bacillus sp. 03113]